MLFSIFVYLVVFCQPTDVHAKIKKKKFKNYCNFQMPHAIQMFGFVAILFGKIGGRKNSYHDGDDGDDDEHTTRNIEKGK